MHLLNKLTFAGLPLIILILSCTEVQVKEDRKFDTGIRANEKVSVILDRFYTNQADKVTEIESKIERCINKELKKLEPPIGTISAETFRKTMLPDIDLFSTPSITETLGVQMKNSEFRKRIKSMSLRYLVILQNKKNIHTDWGLTPGGIMAQWDKRIKLSAIIFDLNKGCCVGDVKVDALGSGWFAQLVIFPIIIPAIVEGPACKALGKKVASFIAENHPK